MTIPPATQAAFASIAALSSPLYCLRQGTGAPYASSGARERIVHGILP